MKKIFSLVSSIACLAVLSTSILSSTVKAQELPEAQNQELPEAQALPNLVRLLKNAGFKITYNYYGGTSIPSTMTAKASRPVSLNTFPSLISYGKAFVHHSFIPTFKVDSAQLPSFLENLQQFQQKYKLNLSQSPTVPGEFYPTDGYTTIARWRPQDLDLFKAYFDKVPSASASLSNSIYIQTIKVSPPSTKVDKARIFYANTLSPDDREKLKGLAKLDNYLKGKGFTITINSSQQEMQARSSGLSLKNFPDLHFYKDKLAFTIVFDPSHVPHVGSKLKALHKKYPSISLIPNGFKTTEGWTATDLNNFKKEFDSFSSNIYVKEVTASLFIFVDVLHNALDYGLVANHSLTPYFDAMEALIRAAKEALVHPILPPG